MSLETMLSMIEQNEEMVLRTTDPDGEIRDIGAVRVGEEFVYTVKPRYTDVAHTHTKAGVRMIAESADREIIPFDKSGYV